MADRSITYPYELLKDVLVRVNDLLFPSNFVILGMLEDFETTLLIGRPFLVTSKALIDVELGELTLRFNKEKVVFNVFETMNYQKENPKCYRIHTMEEVIQEVTAPETPSPQMDHVIINSVGQVENASNMVMVECSLQLQATHVDHAMRKIKELGGNEQQSQLVVPTDLELK